MLCAVVVGVVAELRAWEPWGCHLAAGVLSLAHGSPATLIHLSLPRFALARGPRWSHPLWFAALAVVRDPRHRPRSMWTACLSGVWAGNQGAGCFPATALAAAVQGATARWPMMLGAWMVGMYYGDAAWTRDTYQAQFVWIAAGVAVGEAGASWAKRRMPAGPVAYRRLDRAREPVSIRKMAAFWFFSWIALKV